MKLFHIAVYFTLALTWLLVRMHATERICTSRHIEGKIEMHPLVHAMELNIIDTGHNPQYLIDLFVNPSVPGWLGPCVTEKELVDPWGLAYQYVPIHQPDQIILYHLGADGEVGGAKTASDGYLLHTLDGDALFIESVSLP